MQLFEKIVKLAVSAVFVVSFTVTAGTGFVFADESDKPNDLTIKEADNETDVETTGEDKETMEEREAEEELPSLIPGDFFYFVKLMKENIQLAITLDDYKESQLLADFAAERIAEANALIKAGDKEEAADLLKKAVETQKEAEDMLNGTEETTGSKTEGEEGSTTVEGTATEENTDVEETDVEETTVEATDEEINEETEQVRINLANNIDALTAVLAKIDNPNAQAAIMKNIQKSFAKLAAKIEKRAGFTEESDDKSGEEDDSAEENETVEENSDSDANATLTISEKPYAKDDLNKQAQKEKEKEAEKLIKAQEKFAKAKAKAQEKAAKAKAKAAKKAEKAQQKAAEKAQKAKQKGNNNAAKGKGNGNSNGVGNANATKHANKN
ncbi:DUF5667 domain-containing protein [Virgibacillus doumboii]|uniref:DUF5667 domain-containing protein n=1 Tax=Virgibacillus doumboii TaxID=2697503 RepID=UPI0013DFE8EB|nr:DUF5667 domain-containing protein [Virgibacillus doumboii]